MGFKQIHFEPLGGPARTMYAGWKIVNQGRQKNLLLIEISEDLLAMSDLKIGDDVSLFHDKEEELLRIRKSDAMNKDSRRITKASGNPRGRFTCIKSSYRGELLKVFTRFGGRLRLVEHNKESLTFKMFEDPSISESY